MAQNDILLFAQGASPNVLSQAAWSTSAARTGGFVSGVADSASANKTWRQSNWMAYLLSQWIVDQSGQNILDDGNYANAKNALVAAINSLISTAISAGGFATQVALNNEQSYRLSNDNAEAGARATGDSNEAAARDNADRAIYAVLAASYLPRTTVAGQARTNTVPGDSQVMQVNLVVATGANGGFLHMVTSANVAGVQPQNCYLNLFVGATNVFQDYTYLPMTGMWGGFLNPNSTITVAAQYVTGSGGGWKSTSLNFSCMLVSA